MTLIPEQASLILQVNPSVGLHQQDPHQTVSPSIGTGVGLMPPGAKMTQVLQAVMHVSGPGDREVLLGIPLIPSPLLV